jgi:hypothetical protein
MALETGTYISDLVITNPTSTDPKSQGDDHIRLQKTVEKNTFPNITGAVTATHTELNILDGVTSTTAELNILDGVTSTAAELNILDGVTASTTEINYIDGVTSSIQPQIDLKAPLANPALTGTPTAPTASPGTSGTQIATVDFANALSFASVLPAQTGNAGKVIVTDGTTASWGTVFNTTVVSLVNGADQTKKAALDLSAITTATTRTITFPDANVDLFTPYAKLIYTVTASAAAQLDIEPTFVSTYDRYIILIDDLIVGTNSVALNMRFKVAGSYITTNTYVTRNLDLTQTSGAAQAAIFATIGNASQYYVNLKIEVLNPLSTAYEKTVLVDGFSVSANTKPALVVNNGATGALQGIRLYPGSGTITGTARVYGIRKS